MSASCFTESRWQSGSQQAPPYAAKVQLTRVEVQVSAVVHCLP